MDLLLLILDIIKRIFTSFQVKSKRKNFIRAERKRTDETHTHNFVTRQYWERITEKKTQCNYSLYLNTSIAPYTSSFIFICRMVLTATATIANKNIDNEVSSAEVTKALITTAKTTNSQKNKHHQLYHRHAMKAIFKIACRISKKARKCVHRTNRRHGDADRISTDTTSAKTTTTTTKYTRLLEEASPPVTPSTKKSTQSRKENKGCKLPNSTAATNLFVHIRRENTSSTDNTSSAKTKTPTTKLGTTTLTEVSGQQVNEYLKRPRRNAIFVTTDEEKAGLKLVLRYYIQAQSIKQYLM